MTSLTRTAARSLAGSPRRTRGATLVLGALPPPPAARLRRVRDGLAGARRAPRARRGGQGAPARADRRRALRARGARRGAAEPPRDRHSLRGRGRRRRRLSGVGARARGRRSPSCSRPDGCRTATSSRSGSRCATRLPTPTRQGVVHRDVKPSNVLVPEQPASPAQVAKLTDFGVARVIGGDSLTRTGDVIGTAAYMAPEQAEGREAGAAADLYSLALVLYEALTGVNPIAAGTAAQRARRLGRPSAAAAPPAPRDPPRARRGRSTWRCALARVSAGASSELAPALVASLEQVDDRPGVVESPWPGRTRRPTDHLEEAFAEPREQAAAAEAPIPADDNARLAPARRRGNRGRWDHGLDRRGGLRAPAAQSRRSAASRAPASPLAALPQDRLAGAHARGGRHADRPEPRRRRLAGRPRCARSGRADVPPSASAGRWPAARPGARRAGSGRSVARAGGAGTSGMATRDARRDRLDLGRDRRACSAGRVCTPTWSPGPRLARRGRHRCTTRRATSSALF